MLVLSRRPGESIVINENILVTVTQIRGDTVQIRVDAPEDVAAEKAAADHAEVNAHRAPAGTTDPNKAGD